MSDKEKINVEIENIITELTHIKDKLYDLQESTSSENIFKDLVKLNNIETELYEILILLYSNNKAELDLVKHNHMTHSSKIVDSSINIANKISLLKKDLDHLETKVEEHTTQLSKLNTSSKKNTLKVVLIFFGMGLITFIIFMFSIHYFPEETSKMLEFILSALDTKALA